MSPLLEESKPEPNSRSSARLSALIADVATRLAAATGEFHDAAITEALGRIGTFVGADRAYLMEFDWAAGTTSNTHEWCADGIEPQLELLQDVPTAAVPWFMERLQAGRVEVLAIRDLPPEAKAERELLEPQGIQSILILPVHGPRGLSGFVGFDAVRAARAWTPSDAQLLRVVATILGGVVERQRAHEHLRTSRERLHAVLEAIPDLVFSISRDGRIRYSKSMESRDLLVPAEEGEGKRIQELLPPPIAARLIAAIEETIRTREVQTVRYPLEVPSGRQEFEARFAAQDDAHVMVIVRNVTEQVRAAEALEDHRQRLRGLAEQQTVAEEALRRRVAAEVHDGIAQELAMARMLLARASREPPHLQEASRLAAEVLDRAVTRLDELTVEISPPALRQLGLPAALREAGGRLTALHGVSFEFEELVPYRRLPADREALLYWTARELMINVVRHAEAKRAVVQLDEAGAATRVTVRDDGHGLPSARDPFTSGSGLFSARERLRLVGGELHLAPLPRGTEATVELPRAGSNR